MRLIELQPGAEPVPGYRLRKRLGRGGFGEVWQAESRGGFAVAVKLVARDRLREWREEVRALDVIKTVRHPNLITVFDAVHAEDFLAVIMELADRSLWDRFQEATRQGLPGIPSEEMQEYLEQAARGIDYLNEPRTGGAGRGPLGIQHRDIKPQNLLLMGGGVKVADFGLARPLQHSLTYDSGALTIAYAAPEQFHNQVASRTDQYSLAVTYCQLRGGRLPFGGSALEIARRQADDEPDLGMLPAEERPAVRRALARKPRERWENCRAFVKALRAAAPAERPPGAAVSSPGPPVPDPESAAAPTADSARAPRSTAWTSLPATGSALARPAGRLGPGWRTPAALLLAALFAVSAGLAFWVRGREDPVPGRPPLAQVPATPPADAPSRQVTADPAPTPTPPGLTLTLPGSVELPAGKTVSLPIRVTRSGDAGPVRLQFKDGPAGVTVNDGRDALLPEDQDTVTVEAVADDSVPTQAAEVRVVATAVAASTEAVLHLALKKRPTLALLAPAPVRLRAGEVARSSITVERDGFDGDVLLQFEGGPHEIRVNGGKNVKVPAGQGQVDVEVAASAQPRPPNLSVKVVGTSDLLRAEASLAITVDPARSLKLRLQPETMQVRAGQTKEFKVQAVREGFGGEVGLEFEGAPTGVRVEGRPIPAGSSSATAVVTAAADAPAGPGTVEVVGRSGRLTDRAVLRVICGPPAGPITVHRPSRLGPAVPQAYVLLVGISHYRDEQLPLRPHAEDDAKALYDVFTGKEYLVGEETHVRLLLGEEDTTRPWQPPTKANILAGLEWLRGAGPDDLVVFAFIGRCGSLDGHDDPRCYFAADSTLRGADTNALAADTLGEALGKLRSRHVCLFLDASPVDPTPGEAAHQLDVTDYPFAGAAATVLATDGRSPVLDLNRHDAFVQVLLNGLQGAADREGDEPDGLVTADELTDYLRKELPRLVREHGNSREKELMLFAGGERQHSLLTHNPAAAALVEARLQRWEQLVLGAKLSRPLADEGRELLGRVPRLQGQQALRRLYQQVADGTISTNRLPAERDRLLGERQLPREEAEAFARSVLDAARVVRDRYIEDVKPEDLAGWAALGLYQALDEAPPQDLDARLARARNKNDLLELLADVRRRLGKREELDGHKGVDLSLQRMLSRLSPHAAYVDPESALYYFQSHFVSIGVRLGWDCVEDRPRVVTPVRGSPAHQAGLQAGDLITTITCETDRAGKPLAEPEVTDTRGLPLHDIQKKLFGTAGTEVRLQVEREGRPVSQALGIKRAQVEGESVLGVRRKSDDNWDYSLDPARKIAYVRLKAFRRTTAEELRKVLQALVGDGLNGLVLDLRFNGQEDSLKTAVDVADLFVDDGPIVTARQRGGKETQYRGSHEGSALGFPMVCLVNGGSAGGSEVVAACLQDRGRALIVGERTEGKGVVEEGVDFDRGILRLPVASLWRPSGKPLNRPGDRGAEDDDWGVRPDKGYLVELSARDRAALAAAQARAEVILPPGKADQERGSFKDVQLEKAREYLRARIASRQQPREKK
jgi:C-terminal peptidase prc